MLLRIRMLLLARAAHDPWLWRCFIRRKSAPLPISSEAEAAHGTMDAVSAPTRIVTFADDGEPEFRSHRRRSMSAQMQFEMSHGRRLPIDTIARNAEALVRADR